MMSVALLRSETIYVAKEPIFYVAKEPIFDPKPRSLAIDPFKFWICCWTN
jgi:hypothetical protein